ncbi:hydrogenase iron-sulfur subunit [Candidatus Bathyarchaeota archaeon]|jgi:F420-non-reducing hydrogenase iron-sulfur subunit|nr:hydrogenase iron-sulfur subunit [Candidatus Bathyarchaeota archaeon]
MENNNPKIACFTCNLAFCNNGQSILPSAKVVRVNCIGRIDPVIVLEVFGKGVDGVMLAACQPPDCHYVNGNLQAERAVKMLKKLIGLAGLEPERLKLLWYSPMGEKGLGFYVKEFSEEISKFAPSPLRNELSGVHASISAAKKAASDFRLRVLLGREEELTEIVNAYGKKIPPEQFDDLLDEIVETEFIRNKIHVLTKSKPLSVTELAKALELKPATVLQHIVNMRRRNMITMDHVDGTTPFYAALEA